MAHGDHLTSTQDDGAIAVCAFAVVSNSPAVGHFCEVLGGDNDLILNLQLAVVDFADFKSNAPNFFKTRHNSRNTAVMQATTPAWSAVARVFFLQSAHCKITCVASCLDDNRQYLETAVR